MVDKRNCTFCGQDIEPGTGKLYIKKDGSRYSFCSNKCKKNMVGLKRVNRNVRWTTHFKKQPGPTPVNEGKKRSPKVAAAMAAKAAAANAAPAESTPPKEA